nr:hypothetical protein [Tanacetum cinerariifolium]
MARLAFCDYHNMIAILEKYEHNVDFHPIVDFVEASYIRVETSNEGTKILPTVDGKPRTIFESSIRRNLKLNDEAVISSLPDAELFKNLTLMGVTSLAADEGSMQHQLNELTDLRTRLQRQQTKMASKIAAQELEITSLKAKVKLLEDKDGGSAEPSREDTTIKGMRSNDTEELANVLTFLDATSPPVGEIPTVSVPTGSGMVPTASPIFTTATVTTPYSRRKGKEKMVESPKKKKEDQRRDEQIDRDAEIARIHAEEEMQILIDRLDRNNETVAKYLQEYEQFDADLDIRERIELINDLVKYQDNYAKVLKYQSQQRKPLSKKQQREFYMLVLRSHAGWKTKHFKDLKEKGLRLKQDSATKVKILEEVSEEDLKTMMQLVPVKEVYVESLQVKHPIIDWEIHTEGEDLNQLWALVKETLDIIQASSDKEKELWVELKRLYEPDVQDQLWTQTQALMHDPVE